MRSSGDDAGMVSGSSAFLASFAKLCNLTVHAVNSKQIPDTFERVVRVEATSSQQQQRCQSSTYGCLHNSWAGDRAREAASHPIALTDLTQFTRSHVRPSITTPCRTNASAAHPHNRCSNAAAVAQPLQQRPPLHATTHHHAPHHTLKIA